jgi:hypothetical protein
MEITPMESVGEAATMKSTADETATVETSPSEAASVEAGATKTTSVEAAAAKAASVAASAATSRRHRWRHQANGCNCQQRDNRLARHTILHSQPRQRLKVRIVLENRYWARRVRRSTLREQRLD